MSTWKPKNDTEKVVLDSESGKGLEIIFTKNMSIRELHEIQKYREKDANENMVDLCEILAAKIVSWNYEGVTPSADALLDMPLDVTTEVTQKIMEIIVGSNATTENLVEPSPNGLNLEVASGVTEQ